MLIMLKKNVFDNTPIIVIYMYNTKILPQPVCLFVCLFVCLSYGDVHVFMIMNLN